MASLGSVVVQFVGKDKLSGVASTVSGAISGVNTASGKAKTGFGKLSAAWTASIPIAGAVIAGAATLANGLIEAGQAAMEDKKSSDKLAETLGKVKGVTAKAIKENEDWIGTMQMATHVADTDLRTAVGKLTLATGSLTEAQTLTRIAVDASAGSGKSLSTITDGLAKAVNGNTGALTRQFPWLDKNKDGTVTLKEATDGLKGAYEGAAEAAAETDPWTTLKVIFDELKEAIGRWLLPVMEKLSDWFKSKTNQQKVQDFLTAVGDLAYELGTNLAEAISDVIAWLKKPENQEKIRTWIGYMKSFGEWVAKAATAISTLVTWLGRVKFPTIPDAWRAITGAFSGGRSAGPQTATATVGATAAQAAPAYYYEPTVIVTEEQIYRAVSRLIMRGDARNGRLQVAR